MSSVGEVITELQSPDNGTRRRAEETYASMLAADANATTYQLMELVVLPTLLVQIAQFALISIKQLVPKYWLMGFSQFVGPPLAQELKQQMRTQLMAMVGSSDAKIRAAVAYCIVQIAASDFPDEWPLLLAELYAKLIDFDHINEVLGALTVFGDLFDDLITEDQFWEGGVGDEITANLVRLLQAPPELNEAQVAGLKVYNQAILPTLQSPEALTQPERKQRVAAQVSGVLPVFLSLLDNKTTPLLVRLGLYTAVATFVGAFSRRISSELKSQAMHSATVDLESIGSRYTEEIVLQSADDSTTSTLVGLMCNIVDTICMCAHSVPVNLQQSLYHGLVAACVLPRATLEEYDADFNTFVSDITGVSSHASVRELVGDFLADAPGALAQAIVTTSIQINFTNSGYIEAALFVLELALQNDEVTVEDANVDAILRQATSLIGNDPVVTTRVFLLFPRLFERATTPSAYIVQAFGDMYRYLLAETPEIVRFAALVATPYYKDLDIATHIGNDASDAQRRLFATTEGLVSESDSDGLPPLLEAITVGITLAPASAIASGVVELIFAIALKDAANVQLTLDAQECMGQLISTTRGDGYVQVCESALPIIFRQMEAANGQFTPELYLLLEVLAMILKPPANEELPQQVFDAAFPPVHALVLDAVDNEILQLGTEVLKELIDHGSKWMQAYRSPNGELGLDMMLPIVGKFLSPELSDSAAMNTGLIILLIIEKFQSVMDTGFLLRILEATVRRLVLAKHPVTIENLIMVLCHLVLMAPDDMVAFLKLLKLDGILSLAVVLPIWFESYEVTRGYEKIKQNLMALGKLYLLNDADIAAVVVNGDIIPYEGDKIVTRSLSKLMPEKHTQVSAMLKIMKLLIGELQFQMQQPDEGDLVTHVEEDVDGDGWEDMDDIGVPNYEKLKQYVEEDDEAPVGNDDGSLQQFLVNFFRECAQKNLGNFEMWYPMLSEDEKKVVTEAVVF